MAMSGYEPAPLPQPSTERVRGGRRAAIAVAVLAILVVGTFIWKPWETGHAPPPSTHPITATPAFVFAPPTQPGIATTPTERPPTPAPTRPDFSTPGQIASPKNLGFVSLPPDDLGTFVYCVYGRAGDANGRLVTIVVKPPVVYLGSAARDLVKTVQFRPEIEVNSLEDVFSSEWTALTKGRSEKSRVVDLVALFKEQNVKVDVHDLPPSAVLRVAVVINWMAPDGQKYATQRLYPNAYAPLGDAATDPIPEGCPAHN